MQSTQPVKTFPAKTCKTCTLTFTPRSGRQAYCKDCTPERHRKYPTPCTQCGEVAMKYPSTRYRPFCDMTCRDAYMRAHSQGTYGRQRKPVAIKAPADMRTPLRRAHESGDNAGILAAILLKCDKTESGCWEWQGRLRDGYAYTRIAGKDIATHRLALEASLGLTLGDQPVHHKCANTQCVNPQHLQPVTHRENIAEMLARTYMERRIIALEEALRQASPDHALLSEVSIPR